MLQERLKLYAPHILPSVITSCVLGAVVIVLFVKVNTLNKEIFSLNNKLQNTDSQLQEVNTSLSAGVKDLDKKTQGLTQQISNTKQNIEDVKTQVGGVQQSVGTITGAVGTLQKLAATDPEFLKKYSKVYFMSDNYIPTHLNIIPNTYVYSDTREERFVSEVWPHLQNMLDQAKQDGVSLYVKSAYRSFAEQKSLKSTYSVTYGAGTANTFSADQGYSEHQLGTTLDVISSGQGGKLDGFDKTKAYTWMQENAYKYGFVLSYPKGNKYYTYEPWHWRYVGTKLAAYLHVTNKQFYDLDQREIDAYLVNFFD